MTLTILEPDVLVARTTVTFAQSQRFLASRTADAAPSVRIRTKPTERNDRAKTREEHGAFTPSASDESGLGAPLAENENGDGEPRGEEVTVNERLRIQLLGRDHVKSRAKAKGRREAGAVALAMRMGTKPVPAPAKREERGEGDGLSEDDEGGRSSLGKSKNGARAQQLLEERESAAADGGVEGLEDEDARPRRAGNYLDEVLADRSLRRRKKRKEKDGSVDS